MSSLVLFIINVSGRFTIVLVLYSVICVMMFDIFWHIYPNKFEMPEEEQLLGGFSPGSLPKNLNAGNIFPP